MKLHERLKKARADKGLSQQELEKVSKVHYTNIGRYERGEAKPSSEVLKRLSDALEVSTDYLLNGTMENKASNNLTDEKLLNRFKKIEALPEKKKQTLLEFLDGFIFQATVQQITS
jgi:transcriptional regulator with XRE-family HTH domain